MVLGCSSLQQSLACEVFNSANVQAFRAHPSGVHDNAFPYNNLRDMCHGLRASRSRSSLLLCGWGCVHSFGSLADMVGRLFDCSFVWVWYLSVRSVCTDYIISFLKKKLSQNRHKNSWKTTTKNQLYNGTVQSNVQNFGVDTLFKATNTVVLQFLCGLRLFHSTIEPGL